MIYNPSNWYWLKADGSLFSSARQTVVQDDDTDYVEWKDAGGNPSPYPRDLSGNENDDELARVLTPYGIFVRLTDYAAAKRYSIETGGFTYQGRLIATDRDSQGKIGNGALAATVIGSAFTTQWKAVDGTFFPLNQGDMIAMATAIMAFISTCFDTESKVTSDIGSGKIKTMAQVDAAAWPSP